ALRRTDSTRLPRPLPGAKRLTLNRMPSESRSSYGNPSTGEAAADRKVGAKLARRVGGDGSHAGDVGALAARQHAGARADLSGGLAARAGALACALALDARLAGDANRRRVG